MRQNSTSNGIGEQGIPLVLRRQIAQRVLGDEIDWQSEDIGWLPCPGEHQHTTPSGPRDCILYLNGPPTLSCFHQHCAEEITAANLELRRAIGSAERQCATAVDPTLRSIVKDNWHMRQARAADSLAAHTSLPALIDAYQIEPSEWPRLSPVALYKEPADQWRQVLTLFGWDDILWIGPEVECSSAADTGYSRFFRTMRQWQVLPAAPGKFTCPSTFKPGTHSRSNASVAERRFLVVESDMLKKHEIGAVFKWLGESLRLRAIVDTAGKSLHGWFDFPDAETMRELRDILPQLGCDPALFKPSQPCRLPGALRGSRYQTLLFVDPRRRS
jgi:hypothetical protein